MPAERPDIFTYHDYRAFLRDWLAFLQSNARTHSSLRQLSADVGIASGFLPMVLAGKRNLSVETAARLSEFLKLTISEMEYFEDLVRLTSPAKQRALKRISQSKAYRKRNPKEAEFYTYMSQWYYAAIRELAALKESKLEPEWIQQRLSPRISKGTIRKALEFLFAHGYLEKNPDGTVAPPRETLDCRGPLFSGALTEYHKQMFSIAVDAIEVAPVPARHVIGYTFSIQESAFDDVRKILNRAMDEIEAVESRAGNAKDSVFQVEMAAFPLSNPGKKRIDP